MLRPASLLCVLLALPLAACGQDESPVDRKSLAQADLAAQSDPRAAYEECLAEAMASGTGDDSSRINGQGCQDLVGHIALPDEWIPHLERLVNDADAPATWRRIATRVETGGLTWGEWYDEPQAYPGGGSLLNALHREVVAAGSR